MPCTKMMPLRLRLTAFAAGTAASGSAAAAHVASSRRTIQPPARFPRRILMSVPPLPPECPAQSLSHISAHLCAVFQKLGISSRREGPPAGARPGASSGSGPLQLRRPAVHRRHGSVPAHRASAVLGRRVLPQLAPAAPQKIGLEAADRLERDV